MGGGVHRRLSRDAWILALRRANFGRGRSGVRIVQNDVYRREYRKRCSRASDVVRDVLGGAARNFLAHRPFIETSRVWSDRLSARGRFHRLDFASRYSSDRDRFVDFRGYAGRLAERVLEARLAYGGRLGDARERVSRLHSAHQGL